jgi:hypothetical protein
MERLVAAADAYVEEVEPALWRVRDRSPGRVHQTGCDEDLV